ncbi:peptidase family M28 family [Histoplasma capsulatum var. duboisii H88]|uniref:Peptide hydrolase n=1 Tax=Ajellomyces capsulatus (strain H88) TaxID=544711 RepID=F0U8Z0_AJEC8|nr:peptidase family M28 family [Histoplasma capsulatum var. duboisii H88]QSS52574.1 peptidase family M28 family [Histoplasma capsulatum var. duboisii H88]
MASSRAQRFNPIAFTPWPVTCITTIVYLALLIPILVINLVVPSAPETNPKGVNLTEAWRDLQHLTGGFHPYNSRRNDEVHEWLLSRINSIIRPTVEAGQRSSATDNLPEVFVFDDNRSNLTYSNGGVGKTSIVGVYFESTNIIVYIRGSEDDSENWWERSNGKPKGKGGVLVNAHYDSVSTGYGATDDGIGVVSLLQLLRYFTTPGNNPRKGLVLLFNNGEEDYLNGAHVFSQHPLSNFTHTFLNLEGAGAGGRAALFRTTDTEVTRFYGNTKHPFGSVLAADGFKMGLLRSQTDYVVFNGILGLRGLDLAFIAPRSRYHTDQDDTRHTSIDSLWHMLSASIGTTEGLVSYTGMDFDGKSKGQNKVNSGAGSLGVWFDMFGTAFAVFRLHTLFAISVALLVIAPLVIFITSVILSKTDRMYLFSMSKSLEGTGDQVSLRGLRGFSRTPIILVIATTIPICLAYLLEKVNPYIVHSSQFSVWSMMFSAWIFLAWFLACAADFFRPSALHRAYSYTWIFVATWIMLVINTVYANQKGIAAGYFLLFYFAGAFLATWISYLELFALPRKGDFARQTTGRRPSSLSSRLLTSSADELRSNASPSTAEFPGAAGEDTDPTESTSLLRGQRTTFANYRTSGPGGAAEETDEREDINKGGTFEHEQSWSWTLPRWTWVLQLLLLAPIVLILVGQLALFLTASMCQVGSDGVSTFVVYLACAVFTTLLCIPLFPLIHRFTYHIPTFLFLVFIGTLIYNLVAFPFSPANRLKTFFIQEVDLDNGSSTVSLTGIQPYLTEAINSIPSAAGQNITCDKTTPFGMLERCSWSGLSPNVLGQGRERDTEIVPDKWITYNITKTVGKNKARIEISGRNTRACKLKFDRAVANFQVSGSAVDHRMPPTSRQGVAEIRLWSRTWENTWVVDINWHESADESDDDDDDDEKHDAPQNVLSGKAICMWSDGNQPGVIPALDEVRLYAPSWIAISKAADGLVEASHSFTIQ